LGGVLLGLAQFGDCCGQACKVCYQRCSQQGDVVGVVTDPGQQPRGSA
jgi:hypothetical protein